LWLPISKLETPNLGTVEDKEIGLVEFTCGGDSDAIVITKSDTSIDSTLPVYYFEAKVCFVPFLLFAYIHTGNQQNDRYSRS